MFVLRSSHWLEMPCYDSIRRPFCEKFQVQGRR